MIGVLALFHFVSLVFGVANSGLIYDGYIQTDRINLVEVLQLFSVLPKF